MNQILLFFEDNLRVTNTVTNQKFPEAAIDDNGRLHLTWVNIDGSNKNIMYTWSDDAGNTFSAPIHINYVDDNISGSLGIMLDDIIASIYSILILSLTFFFLGA